jgi:hypothetical protein
MVILRHPEQPGTTFRWRRRLRRGDTGNGGDRDWHVEFIHQTLKAG